MTIGLPNWQDRPDRVHACTVQHRGPCDVCGFDGAHDSRVQRLERRQFRGACTCAWYGPIRDSRGLALADAVYHRTR